MGRRGRMGKRVRDGRVKVGRRVKEWKGFNGCEGDVDWGGEVDWGGGRIISTFSSALKKCLLEPKTFFTMSWYFWYVPRATLTYSITSGF